ncbi:MAG: hypothetical protein ACI4RR_07915, partial [Eubacterium sp.]
MKKFGNRILAVLIAVIMIVTAMPFTAITAYASGEKEVYGYVDIDPIIYIHGDSLSGDEYDYMKYGSKISDGTYDGECQTNIIIDPAKACVGVELVKESQGNTISIVDGHLAGDLGASFTNTKSDNAVLKFNFSDNTYELHEFAVKTNPVAKHTLVGIFGYEGIIPGSRRMEAFEVLAKGSMSTHEVVGKVALLDKDKNETSESK